MTKIIISLFLFLIWSGFIYILLKITKESFEEKYIEVCATVVSVDSHVAPKNKKGQMYKVYCPYFKYIWNGWERQIHPSTYKHEWDYEVGDKIFIYINLNDLSDMRIEPMNQAFFIKVYLIGLLFVLATYFGL